jgi:hypothetical protein
VAGILLASSVKELAMENNEQQLHIKRDILNQESQDKSSVIPPSHSKEKWSDSNMNDRFNTKANDEEPSSYKKKDQDEKRPPHTQNRTRENQTSKHYT